MMRRLLYRLILVYLTYQNPKTKNNTDVEVVAILTYVSTAFNMMENIQFLSKFLLRFSVFIFDVGNRFCKTISRFLKKFAP